MPVVLLQKNEKGDICPFSNRRTVKQNIYGAVGAGAFIEKIIYICLLQHDHNNQ